MYGLYIFCITRKAKMNGFNIKGLNNQSVSCVDYKDIMALLHAVEGSVLSENGDGLRNELMESVMKHHEVVEEAWGAFGTLIPMRFGSVIHGKDETDAIQNVRDWLERISGHIERRFDDLQDRAEYGIQIFWSKDSLMKKVFRNYSQIKHMEKKIAKISQEDAFAYKDRHKSLVNRYITKEIVLASRSLLDRVRPYLHNFQIEHINAEDDDKRMLLNISCLLSDEEISEIRQKLETIKKEEGYISCLSGPWPPYSFAKLDEKLVPSNGPTCHVRPGGIVRCA